MKSKLEKEIRKEIKQYRKEYGKHWGMEYFDNFDHHLPGGYTREPGSNLNYKAWEGDNEASLKLKEQSLGEFLKTIDKVIEEIGIEPLDIIKGREDRFKDDKFFKLITPIYIKLRELGYNHYSDLAA